MLAAIWPAGSTPSAGRPSTMAFWITMGALAAISVWAAVRPSLPPIFSALPSNWTMLAPL
ncbi:hypothetical protein FQZ97_1156980 [compost metagenome]